MVWRDARLADTAGALFDFPGAPVPTAWPGKQRTLQFASSLAAGRLRLLDPAAIAEAEARVLKHCNDAVDNKLNPPAPAADAAAAEAAPADGAAAAAAPAPAATAAAAAAEPAAPAAPAAEPCRFRAHALLRVAEGPSLPLRLAAANVHQETWLEQQEMEEDDQQIALDAPPGSEVAERALNEDRVSGVAAALARARVTLRLAQEAEADAARRCIPLVMEAAPALAEAARAQNGGGGGEGGKAKRRKGAGRGGASSASAAAASEPQAAAAPTTTTAAVSEEQRAADRAVFAAAACVGRWGEIRASCAAASKALRAAEAAFARARADAEAHSDRVRDLLAAQAQAPVVAGAPMERPGYEEFSDAGSSADGSEDFAVIEDLFEDRAGFGEVPFWAEDDEEGDSEDDFDDEDDFDEEGGESDEFWDEWADAEGEEDEDWGEDGDGHGW